MENTQATHRWCVVALAGILLLAVLRIVSGYDTSAQTIDERTHIAAGLEWIESGRYTYNVENPPLAPVAVAIGPYILGARAVASPEEANNIFHAGPTYHRTLSAARVGNIFFLIAAALLVYVWALRTSGPVPAVLAVLLFTSMPAVLGHAGLATTDIAAVASFTGAALAMACWLDQPTKRKAMITGAAIGVAFLVKFSLIPFLALTAIFGFLARKRLKHPPVRARLWVQSGAAIALTAMVILWGGYRFAVGSLASADRRPHVVIDEYVAADGSLHDLAYAVVEAPIYPAPAFFLGVADLARHAARGHGAFLFGEISNIGWWYYFPVVLLFKTPLPILFLVGIGGACVVRGFRSRGSVLFLFPLLGIAGVLLVAMASRINIGTRHVLPLYPLFAVLSAYALDHAMRSGGRIRKHGLLVPLLLVVWQLISSTVAHPRYLGWTNVLAGSKPERILVDSDLDWGQDVALVAGALPECSPDQTYLALFSNADLSAYGLDGYPTLDAAVPAHGCVAISVTLLKLQPQRYNWLERLDPLRRVGDSILIYRIGESP